MIEVTKLDHYIESEDADADLYFEEVPPEEVKALVLKLHTVEQERDAYLSMFELAYKGCTDGLNDEQREYLKQEVTKLRERQFEAILAWQKSPSPTYAELESRLGAVQRELAIYKRLPLYHQEPDLTHEREDGEDYPTIEMCVACGFPKEFDHDGDGNCPVSLIEQLRVVEGRGRYCKACGASEGDDCNTASTLEIPADCINRADEGQEP